MRFTRIFSILIVALFAVVSCSQKRAIDGESSIESGLALVPPPDVEEPPGSDPDEEILTRWTAWWSEEAPSNLERLAWSKHVLKETERLAGSSLVSEPLDLSAYCPKWKTLSLPDRKGFFLSLISAMSKFESGFDPTTEYKENFKDSKGNWIISRGLLQLSVESANGYGCQVTENSLHDAKTNLTCAIIILNRWVAKDRYFGSSIGSAKNKHVGGARYWSVLREKSKSRDKIRNFTSSQKMCQ